MSDKRVTRLPGNVSVGPFRYKLLRSAKVDGAENWGSTDYVVRELRFGEECDSRQMPVTFIHELIHAVNKCYTIGLKESEVERLANGLTQSLQEVGFLPELLLLKGEGEQ